MKLNSGITPDRAALRGTAEALAQARQLRVAAGERIRSGLQTAEAEEVLREIRAGAADGPVPFLGRAYRRNWEQVQEMERRLTRWLSAHPAWSWLRSVPGVEPAQAAQLLSRLDVTRAPSPSSFWSYCGLATVATRLYRCEECGWQRSLPEGGAPPSEHHPAPGSPACRAPLHEVRQMQTERMAQPRRHSGTRGAYNEEAKAICFEIGTSIREAGHAYERYYRREREKLDLTRPEWPAGRRQMTAFRKMEKLFLAHLWLVWRQALGLTLTEPFPGAEGAGDPWTMTRVESRRRWQRPDDRHPNLHPRAP